MPEPSKEERSIAQSREAITRFDPNKKRELVTRGLNALKTLEEDSLLITYRKGNK
jgi:hypothetical protein